MFRYYVLIMHGKWHSNNVPKSMKKGILIYTMSSLVNPEICNPLVITFDDGVFVPTGPYWNFGLMQAYFHFLQVKLVSKEVIEHIIEGSELKTREYQGFNGDESYEFSGVMPNVTAKIGTYLTFTFTNEAEEIISVDWLVEPVCYL
jgi:hypothetical protein